VKQSNQISSPRLLGRTRRSFRRAFNLVELVIALAITSALLTSVLVALNASFMAYQSTTEVASTHTIGRLTMHRIMAMIRVGKEFGPFPTDPLAPTVWDKRMQFRNPNGQLIELIWDSDEEALYVGVDGTEHLLIENVVAQFDADGNQIMPFTLEYEKGRHLHRATIDLMIKPDDNMSMALDGDNQDVIRLVASAMPRTAAY
jgi:prepilin-type N-terminal cleavage/methylation domain-containing protein